MFSFRHFAMATIAGAALSFGMIGCGPSEQRPDVVPNSAMMQGSGNSSLQFTAPRDGKAYVYDHNAGRLLWAGAVKRGQSIDVDPVKNRISVDGVVVVEKSLYGGNRNDIYYQPSYPAEPEHPQNTGTPNNNGVTLTPSVTVQPANAAPNSAPPPPGSVTVQPGLNVTPAPQQTPPPQN